MSNLSNPATRQSTPATPIVPPPTLSLSPSRYDLFVFGDSFSDIGRFFQVTSQATGGLFPLPPSPPYDRGRFSDGPVAVEWLASQLGLNITLNTDFAIAGATTSTVNVNDRPLLPQFGGLQNQISSFRSQATQLGADANDLYVIWAGGNDFINLPNLNPDTISTAITNAVANIAAAATSLAQAGARNIVVAQTANLGRLPQSLNAGLLEPLTALSRTFNSALSASLNAIEPTLNGANIILADLFNPIEEVAQNPAAFGFSNVTQGYLKSVLEPVPQNPAVSQAGFFFWDQVHPTTAAHVVFRNAFAQSIISGITENLRRVGTAENNTVTGFGGNDRVLGQGGDDFLFGFLGNDRVDGGDGDDLVDGGAGDDFLIGGRGNDRLFAEAGRDRLVGAALNDRRLGRGETDTLVGGANADLFVLGDRGGAFYVDRANQGNRSFATIGDFEQRDRIQLAGNLEDYAIRRVTGAPTRQVGIFLEQSGGSDLVGIVSNTANVNLVTRAIVTV